MEPSVRKLTFVVVTHYMQVIFVNDETRDRYETCHGAPDPLQVVYFTNNVEKIVVLCIFDR